MRPANGLLSLSIVLLTWVLPSACATAPPPKPPSVSFEQKIAWIFRLEDQRILSFELPAPPVVTPGKRGAPPPPPSAVPDLTKLVTDADSRVRRRAALAIGR